MTHFTATVWQRTKDNQCFVTIPRRNQYYDLFPPGKPVTLSLVDNPDVRMQSHVRIAGGGRRYAKIMRRKQRALADQFAEGVEVRVEMTDEVQE